MRMVVVDGDGVMVGYCHMKMEGKIFPMSPPILTSFILFCELVIGKSGQYTMVSSCCWCSC